MTWKATQSFNKKAAVAGFTFQDTLRRDFEEGGGIQITALNPQFVHATSPQGDFEILLEGSLPSQTLVRQKGLDRTVLANRIAFLRVTAFDKDRHFLKDEPSSEELKTLYYIQFEIGIHEEKEDPKLLINDHYKGVDLDGDPSNGVAPVFSKTIEVIPK